MWSRRRMQAGGAAMGALALAAGALVASCSKDVSGAGGGPTTEYGTPVAVGNGTARSYLVLQGGVPTELGVALSQGAVDSLPLTPKMGGYEYLLPLPTGNPTQYQVIGLNWNPTGHPPAGVYTVPHFDVHFYMISLADRNAIAPSNPAFATEAANLPAAGYRPADYVSDPPANAVPMMGLHWTDSSAAEFHGVPFTRTLIAGSWNGQFIFFEPMVARAYLLTHPDDSIPFAGASQRAIGGYYPAAYRVGWDGTKAEWHIGLANLTN